MFNLKKIVFIIIFITTLVNAQVKKIQFISNENQLPLSNVKVYNGNLLIGNTDQNGYLDIETEDLNYILTIKEDYEDSVIKIPDLKEKVILIKNKTIESNDINTSVTKILNRIQDNFDQFDNSLFSDQGNYKLPRYFNATNKLLIETDTLHYLNGMMKYEKGKGWVYQIDKNYRLVKNFKHVKVTNNNIITNAGNVYSNNEKDVEFYELLTLFYTIDDDHVLEDNILKKRKEYNYIITNIGDFYKIEFECKSKSPFERKYLSSWKSWRENVGFNGYLIVDKKDFGIYEFKARLSNNNANNIEQKVYNSILNLEQKYLVTGIDYHIKYQKNKDGYYQLLFSYSDEQFEQTQGNFIGKKFSYSSKVEAGDNHKNASYIDFDIYTYELK